MRCRTDFFSFLCCIFLRSLVGLAAVVLPYVQYNSACVLSIATSFSLTVRYLLSIVYIPFVWQAKLMCV